MLTVKACRVMLLLLLLLQTPSRIVGRCAQQCFELVDSTRKLSRPMPTFMAAAAITHAGTGTARRPLDPWTTPSCHDALLGTIQTVGAWDVSIA
jgi:hypothetical protein